MATMYKWKTKPYRHQVAAVKEAIPALRETGGFALLMEPRTGKTKTTIDIISIQYLLGETSRVVVVAPLGVLHVWVDEIRKHCPHRCRITVWDKKGRKGFDLPPKNSNLLEWVLINYEAFSTPGAIIGKDAKGAIKRSRSRGGRFEVRKLIRNWDPHMMVLDESHRIKTAGSKKTSTIWSVAYNTRTNVPRIRYRMILTGTVLTKRKRIFDIYSQWMFLNRESPLIKGLTLSEFKALYAIFRERAGYSQWLRNRPGSEEKLRRKLHAESFAVTRDECYDLPDRLDPVIIRVPLEESAPYYDKMAEEMVIQLESGEISWAKIPLVQRLRLAQATSGIVKTEPSDRYPEGRLVRVGHEKLRYLEDILYDQLEADEKVVIGARFRGDISAIVALAKKLKAPIWELHGGIDSGDRPRQIREFQQHKGGGLFIAQPAAGSLGIDLSSSATMVWYSLVDSWVDFTQFEDRIALSGKARRYIYLLAEGTVNEVQYEGLAEDGDVAKRITESPHRLLRNFKN